MSEKLLPCNAQKALDAMPYNSALQYMRQFMNQCPLRRTTAKDESAELFNKQYLAQEEECLSCRGLSKQMDFIHQEAERRVSAVQATLAEKHEEMRLWKSKYNIVVVDGIERAKRIEELESRIAMGSEHGAMLDEANVRNAELEAKLKSADADSQRYLDAFHEVNGKSKRAEAVVEAAINDEPEGPDGMPDEMWEAIKGDRDAAEELYRIAIRLTKEGILQRYRSVMGRLDSGSEKGSKE